MAFRKELLKYVLPFLTNHNPPQKVFTAAEIKNTDIPELMHEIYDEYDTESEIPRIVKLSGEKWRIPGESTIDSVNTELETELVEGEFNTIGGYVIERLGAVPVPGAVVDVPELHLVLTVERMEGHRVASVILEKKNPDSESVEAGGAGSVPEA